MNQKSVSAKVDSDYKKIKRIKVSASSLAKLDVENLRFIQRLDKNGSMESVV